MEKTKNPYLDAVSGPDAGRRIHLPDGAAEIGRSSDNGIVIKDPLLSRRHCRVERGADGITLRDLGSANGTLVNGREITVATLRDGDEISIGDTRLVFHDEAPAAPPAPAPLVDLGFSGGDGADAAAARPNWRPLLWTVAAVAVLALAASFILRGDGAGETPKIAAPAETPLLPLVIDYEKVVADNSNIFRYRMALSPARTLSVEIDDLGEDRHIRKDTVVTEESATRLARQLERAGLFALEPLAPGVSADGSLARQAAAVALGGRATSICAENRIPPPAFAAVCELLETFGRNELGIWAIQYPAERLVELALECQTRAANLFAQRDISHGNIHAALRSCREGVFYLETVEPKPEFYADMLNLLGDAEAELERRCDERRFRADRAINLKDWNAAAAELRVLRELVPDEGDPRNADATRKLLDVENRIQKER